MGMFQVKEGLGGSPIREAGEIKLTEIWERPVRNWETGGLGWKGTNSEKANTPEGRDGSYWIF